MHILMRIGDWEDKGAVSPSQRDPSAFKPASIGEIHNLIEIIFQGWRIEWQEKSWLSIEVNS